MHPQQPQALFSQLPATNYLAPLYLTLDLRTPPSFVSQYSVFISTSKPSMKLLLTLGWSLGLAAAALQAPISAKDAEKVPGKNVLTYCDSPDSDILKITNVDLSPNPPEKYAHLSPCARRAVANTLAEARSLRSLLPASCPGTLRKDHTYFSLSRLDT